MIKAIVKTVLIACGCVVLPIILVIVAFALGVTLPLFGALMILFLPMVLAGVIIGYNSRKKGEKES